MQHVSHRRSDEVHQRSLKQHVEEELRRQLPLPFAEPDEQLRFEFALLTELNRERT